MTHEFSRGTLEGCTVAACLTVAQHLAFWHVQDRVPLLARYALGVGAIGAGVFTASHYLTPRELARAYWLIAGAAALAPTIGRFLRKPDRLDALDQLIQEGDSHAVWRSDIRRT